MTQLGMLSEGTSLLSLTSKDAWLEAHSEIGKLCVGIIWGKELVTSNLDREVSQAASIASDLLQRAPEFYLSVSDALWHLPSLRGGELQVLAPEACDLLFQQSFKGFVMQCLENSPKTRTGPLMLQRMRMESENWRLTT